MASEEAYLLDLLTNLVPPGVDEAAYVKLGFLTAVAKRRGIFSASNTGKAIELLATMHSGYNISPLVYGAEQGYAGANHCPPAKIHAADV